MRSKWFAPIVIGVMLLFSAVLYGQLPNRIPIHFGINGSADQYGDKWYAVLLMPGISLLVWALLLTLPSIDPKREFYKVGIGTYWLVVNLIVLFLGVIHFVMLGIAAGWNISITQVICIAIGLLFVLLGNQFPRIQPNWFMGIRTPWTLSDEEVWKRTHRLGGRVFVIAGIILALAGIIAPGPLALVVMMGVLTITVLIPVVYSYRTWRQLHPEHV